MEELFELLKKVDVKTVTDSYSNLGGSSVQINIQFKNPLNEQEERDIYNKYFSSPEKLKDFMAFFGIDADESVLNPIYKPSSNGLMFEIPFSQKEENEKLIWYFDRVVSYTLQLNMDFEIPEPNNTCIDDNRLDKLIEFFEKRIAIAREPSHINVSSVNQDRDYKYFSPIFDNGVAFQPVWLFKNEEHMEEVLLDAYQKGKLLGPPLAASAEELQVAIKQAAINYMGHEYSRHHLGYGDNGIIAHDMLGVIKKIKKMADNKETVWDPQTDNWEWDTQTGWMRQGGSEFTYRVERAKDYIALKSLKSLVEENKLDDNGIKIPETVQKFMIKCADKAIEYYESQLPQTLYEDKKCDQIRKKLMENSEDVKSRPQVRVDIQNDNTNDLNVTVPTLTA